MDSYHSLQEAILQRDIAEMIYVFAIVVQELVAMRSLRHHAFHQQPITCPCRHCRLSVSLPRRCYLTIQVLGPPEKRKR
jgi:hypothetical protein